MLKVIKQRQREFVEDYELFFETQPGGGFSFPCDNIGGVYSNRLTPEGRENLRKCWDGEIKTTKPPRVVNNSYWHEHPEVRECRCGKPLEMVHDSEGIVYCHCGRMFNTSGSELRPRSEWENYDDDY